MTNDDEPIAIPSVTDAQSLRHRFATSVAAALSGLQRGAEQRGLDRLTLDDVNEEIQAVRKDRGHDPA